jgi:hypothetical protein
MKMPEKLDATEEAILRYLYDNPTPDGQEAYLDTFQLVNHVRPEPANGFNEEQQKENFKQTQHAIETLIESKFVKGTRLRSGGPGGSVYFAHLELTTSGEAEAIRQKRKVKEVVVDPTHRPPRPPIS